MIKGDPQRRISFSLHHIQVNEIFPGGKVKYFLRKYEILLTQYEICPLGILRYHFVMIEIQNTLLQFCNRVFFI